LYQHKDSSIWAFHLTLYLACNEETIEYVKSDGGRKRSDTLDQYEALCIRLQAEKLKMKESKKKTKSEKEKEKEKDKEKKSKDKE